MLKSSPLLAAFILGMTIVAAGLSRGAVNAAPSSLSPSQFCNSDGTVTIGVNWNGQGTLPQRLDVSLSAGFESYNSVSTSSGKAAIEGATPGTEYFMRVLDGDGKASPTFSIVAMPCIAYPPPGTPECGLTSELVASGKLTLEDLTLREDRFAPVGVYEGEWFATTANTVVPAGKSVGQSVVVIRDVAPLAVAYVFNSNRVDIRNWRYTSTPGNLLAVTGGFPPLVFTPQADGSLKAQAFFQGQVTSEGTFHLCRPSA